MWYTLLPEYEYSSPGFRPESIILAAMWYNFLPDLPEYTLPWAFDPSILFWPRLGIRILSYPSNLVQFTSTILTRQTRAYSGATRNLGVYPNSTRVPFLDFLPDFSSALNPGPGTKVQVHPSDSLHTAR